MLSNHALAMQMQLEPYPIAPAAVPASILDSAWVQTSVVVDGAVLVLGILGPGWQCCTYDQLLALHLMYYGFMVFCLVDGGVL